jgi:hypothetical protein
LAIDNSGENWLTINRPHVNLLVTPLIDWSYSTDIHTKIALTYALERDSSTAINYISENFEELPRRYPHAETIFGIYYSFNDYARAIKLCTQLGEVKNENGYRADILAGCSAAYRAVKQYDLAIKTLAPLGYDAAFASDYALNFLYLYEAGKFEVARSQLKVYKGSSDAHVSLVFAIIHFEIGKLEAAKKFLNLYLRGEYYHSGSNNFWSKDDLEQGEVEAHLWPYLTPKERDSLSKLVESVKRDGPVLDDELDAFKNKYF